MISVLATNITSPLGMTTEENYQAVLSGRSVLSTYQDWKGLSEPFAASMFSEKQRCGVSKEGYSRFESMVICSVAEALSHVDIPDFSRTAFILSTTKGNVEELGASEDSDGDYLHPAETARKIARHFGIEADPIVVSNACISGVSGQIVAQRLIEAGAYDTAIVCGADCVTPFIVGGFQSFKALSPERCRPFDANRRGLNLGEAAAAIVYTIGADEELDAGTLIVQGAAINNDANHISGPSRTGEGLLRSITKANEGFDTSRLAFINAHGTATLYNDDMESFGISRSAISPPIVPVATPTRQPVRSAGARLLLFTSLRSPFTTTTTPPS